MMQHDYGIKESGLSFEYVNIYSPLCDILSKENVVLFDFFAEYKKSGKDQMNKKLRDFIKTEKPISRYSVSLKMKWMRRLFPH